MKYLFLIFLKCLILDDELTILTLFCTFKLPKIKLTFLEILGKYSYSKLDQVLSVRVHFLWNRLFILVEATRTFKTLTYCFISFSFLLKDCTDLCYK